jgi:hypothetical protein
MEGESARHTNDMAELLSCKLLSTLAAAINPLYFSRYNLEIINGEPCQNSILFMESNRMALAGG